MAQIEMWNLLALGKGQKALNPYAPDKHGPDKAQSGRDPGATSSSLVEKNAPKAGRARGTETLHKLILLTS